MEIKYIKLKIMWQTVKKALFVIIILFSSISGLYAAKPKNITLIIQGTGSQEIVDGFKYALKIEANAAGYDVSDNPTAAKYFIKFNVVFDQAEQKSRFSVSLIKMADQSEIVTMEYLFTDEEEMLLYSQLVFFMLMANLPEDEIEQKPEAAPEDDSWRNKLLYLRASVDYSIMLLELQSTGSEVLGGVGMWNSSNPSVVAPLDNKVVPVFGIGLGAEVQVLDFLSLEPGLQFSYENAVEGNATYNLLLTMSVKFPLKFFNSFVPEPYIMAAYPMRFKAAAGATEVFNLPPFALGGGVQVAVKMQKSSAIFFEASYLYYGDVTMKNQYSKLYDKPEWISYNYSVVCFKFGYKYGLFDRKKKKGS